ncbi:AMP-binding protein [Culturomica massiliensis]|jgi:long-chain acyl-CoA synthetase|uniref:AMP-binding protein n=1 Tax=Culturomica massiliensis TaxID=1841857 RepID=UPI000E56002B|nr:MULTISPECIES: AMP-binding protein [Odoribacteraceae]RHV96902.1 long-chain fatty acid--CoA ligase [Odoribacter sp. OF09-27XD]
MEESFIQYIEQSIKNNWDKPSLTDFKGVTSSYKDVARKIEKLHILFEHSNIRKGDKIALCSRNMSTWGIAFLATLTYGAVAVPILNEFKPDNIHHIVNHSEARLLFVGDVVWENLDESAMPDIDGAIRIEDFSLRHSNKKSLTKARERLNELFGKKFPERFMAENVKYNYDRPDELAMINYTSGTTSSSKGVMLPYRSLWTNLKFALGVFGLTPGEQIVSMLPMAHMYGLAFEFIYEFASGMHIHFLSRTPSPKIIADAFAEVKPNLIITVPLVIEKIIKKRIFPTIEKPHMKILMNIPIINDKIRDTIRQKVIQAFGGKFKELIVGGAALNKEVESFLRSIRFPYTVGYGMTECGPLLSYDDWQTFKQGSCGKAVPRVELRIDSDDPQHVVGEILAKGDCVMTGYYKNPEATAAALDKEGWLHTGDLGLIDADGYLFIKGRCKNMILGPSGQNIYPEEIEDRLNNMLYVTESIVVEQDGKLVALVYPDFDAVNANHISDTDLPKILETNLKELNHLLPAYSQISRIKIYNEEFEKTPKRSIKRFLYK